jgi:hypothetical protein
VPEGRARLVEEDAARKLFPEIFDRAVAQPGAVQRVDAWWPDQFFWPDPDDKGTALYACSNLPTACSTATPPTGSSRWGNGPEGTLHVTDLVSVTRRPAPCCGATYSTWTSSRRSRRGSFLSTSRCGGCCASRDAWRSRAGESLAWRSMRPPR